MGKRTKWIAGKGVTLEAGKTYIVTRPGNYVGPVKIKEVDKTTSTSVSIRDTVLELDLDADAAKRFVDQFPAGTIW